MISSFPTVTVATTQPALERQANSHQCAAEPWGRGPQHEKIKVRRERGDPQGEKSERTTERGLDLQMKKQDPAKTEAPQGFQHCILFEAGD